MNPLIRECILGILGGIVVGMLVIAYFFHLGFSPEEKTSIAGRGCAMIAE